MQTALDTLLQETYKELSSDREPRDDDPLLDQLETVSEICEKLELYSASILWQVFRSGCKVLAVVSNDDCTMIDDRLDAMWDKLSPWISTRESMIESLLQYHVYRCLKLIYSGKCPGVSNETRLKCLRVGEHQSSHLLQRHFWLREPIHMLHYAPQAIRNFVVFNNECLTNLTRVLLCFDILSTETRDYEDILDRVSELLSRYREDFRAAPLDYASILKVVDRRTDRKVDRRTDRRTDRKADRDVTEDSEGQASAKKPKL